MSRFVFRTSSAYELVVFDHLLPHERSLLHELERDAELFGVLRPRTAAGTLKAVAQDTALLWFTLQEPGPLPAFARAESEGEVPPLIGQLVLDGVLEVRRDGAFVSGPAAVALLGGSGKSAISSEADAEGSLVRLSRQALLYGQGLDLDDPQRLSARLYCYNRLPLTPRWRRRFRDHRAVTAALGVAAEQPLCRRLARDYLVPSGQRGDGWLSWHRRDAEASVSAHQATFKLYVSPRPEALATAFEAVCEVRPQRFKVGADAAGLLRPDKFVVYFRDFESLTREARQLVRLLEGVPAHGVPFTAPVCADGLLSWGVDPPEDERLLSWRQRESWRLWLTNRLAAALFQARAGEAETKTAVEATAQLPPWRFALERMRSQGVDTDRWVPSARLWSDVSRMEVPWTSQPV